MSEDRPGTGAPGDGLSEDQVTQLLAAAGAAQPMPPDVADRLDTVLADLVAEREGTAASTEDTGGTAPVVALSERRGRRTWAPRLLVAAAVLGLVGIGFSVADDLAGGSASTESATAGDAAGSAGEESATRSEPGAGSGGGADSEQDRDTLRDDVEAPEAAAEAMRLPEVLQITDTASLRAAVRVTGDAGDPGDPGDPGDTANDSDAELSQGYDPRVGALDSRRNALRSASVACVVPRGTGSRTLVTYEGSPATLVVRRVGDRLDGRVYDCDLGLQLDGVEIGPPGE